MATNDQPAMSASKKTSIALALAVAIAAPCEGLRQKAYIDPVGVPTVCFGTTRGIVPGKTYTVDECKALLSADMSAAVATVDRCQPGLPPEVLGAFASAAYNMGPTIACNQQASTAARYLHAGRLVDACNQLPMWNKARVAGLLVPLPGLTNRRALERTECLKGTQS